MASQTRPLSPHLQIYRPQMTSVLSILHRLTGVALTVGTLLLVYWLVAAAAATPADPEPYRQAQALFGSFIGKLLLFGWSFALFYHLCNGMRHLAWDAGWGLDIETATLTGWLTVGAAIGLTLVAWFAWLVS